jgi:hypothetical protein
MESARSDMECAYFDMKMAFPRIKQALGCSGSSTPTHPGGFDVRPKNSRSGSADRRRRSRRMLRSDCTNTRRMSGHQRFLDLRRHLIGHRSPDCYTGRVEESAISRRWLRDSAMSCVSSGTSSFRVVTATEGALINSAILESAFSASKDT